MSFLAAGIISFGNVELTFGANIPIQGRGLEEINVKV